MLRRILSWLGLLLLVASFIWLLLWPNESTRSVPVTRAPAKKREPLVIVLDPGHGGADSGATCGSVLEKDLTLDVALRASQLLRARGLRTLLTRNHDCYLSLADRAAAANREKNSLFISIHFNEGTRAEVSGVETYFAARSAKNAPDILGWLPFLQSHDPALQASSENLAESLQTALVERTRAINRGTKLEQFYVIANVSHPAALIEGGFITNPGDAQKLESTEYRQQIACAIDEGVRHYRLTSVPEQSALAWSAAPAE